MTIDLNAAIVLPAQAGMIPAESSGQQRIVGAPRARGDDPKTDKRLISIEEQLNEKWPQLGGRDVKEALAAITGEIG